MDAKNWIASGQASLGIEFGSTRIKAVITGPDFQPLATGSHDWENRYEDGYWTYSLDDIWTGLRACYADLVGNVAKRYGVALSSLKAMGVSAMMHGYLPFDQAGQLLTPFRTWRNTTTGQAAERLTQAFSFNIPQRWSVAHLYQAILNGEDHVNKIAHLTTLAGYVHWQLTGEQVLGVGEASGMFPLDGKNYDQARLSCFNELIKGNNLGWSLKSLLPRVLDAGQLAGELTPEGARLLDPSGLLQPGIPFCPPEGDAGTGMVATNSVSPRTGNISAGTSIFAMLVLEAPLSKVYPEIDMVTTPSGSPVAMVHCNNCSTELDAWVRLFGEANALFGGNASANELYGKLYNLALSGDSDGGGLLCYNYHSGEHITGLTQGRPMFVRTPESRFNLPNFIRTLLFGSMATLRIGMDILTRQEHVAIDRLTGHGGLFKTKGVGQKIMAGALRAPVTVMDSAGEGGAWGIALLAGFMAAGGGLSLGQFLEEKVFAGQTGETLSPDESDAQGFDRFIERFKAGLSVEEAATKYISEQGR